MENWFGLFSLVSGRRRIRLQEDEVAAAHPSCCTLWLACWVFATWFCWEGWFAWDWGGICLQTERDNIYQLVNTCFVYFLRPESWTLFYISSGHCSIFILQGNSDSSCAFRMQLWSLWLLCGIKIFLHLNPERPNVPYVECFARVCARLKCPVCGAGAGSSPGREQCRQGQSP